MLWLFQMRSGFISRHRGLSGPPPAAPIRFVRQLHPGMLCSVSSLRTFPASFRGLHCIQPLLLDGDVSCEGIHVVTLSLAGGPSHTSTVGLIVCTHLRFAATTLFVRRKGVNEAVPKPPSGNTQAVGKCKCSCLGTCLFPFSPSSGFPVQDKVLG